MEGTVHNLGTSPLPLPLYLTAYHHLDSLTVVTIWQQVLKQVPNTSVLSQSCIRAKTNRWNHATEKQSRACQYSPHTFVCTMQTLCVQWPDSPRTCHAEMKPTFVPFGKRIEEYTQAHFLPCDLRDTDDEIGLSTLSFQRLPQSFHLALMSA